MSLFEIVVDAPSDRFTWLMDYVGGYVPGTVPEQVRTLADQFARTYWVTLPADDRRLFVSVSTFEPMRLSAQGVVSTTRTSLLESWALHEGGAS